MRRLLQPWERFWFTPAPTSTLAVVRISYGLVLLAWALSLAPDLSDFFSASGVVPSRPLYPGAWTPLEWFDSGPALVGMWSALVVAAGLLVVGFHTRVAAAVAFLALLSFTWRNPLVFNSGDGLLRIFALFLMLSPAGDALSVDRWRRAGSRRFWEFPLRSPWALRLMQVQLSMVYVFTIWTKVRGKAWNDGTAVSYVLRIEELARVSGPAWVAGSPVVSNILTYGTLAIEFSLAFLIWNRRARPWVLLLGVALHLMIETAITVGFFTFVIFVGYLAFIPAETMSRWVLATRTRMRGSRVRTLRRLGWAGDSRPLPGPAPTRRPRRKAGVGAASAHGFGGARARPTRARSSGGP